MSVDGSGKVMVRLQKPFCIMIMGPCLCVFLLYDGAIGCNNYLVALCESGTDIRPRCKAMTKQRVLVFYVQRWLNFFGRGMECVGK